MRDSFLCNAWTVQGNNESLQETPVYLYMLLLSLPYGQIYLCWQKPLVVTYYLSLQLTDFHIVQEKLVQLS